MACNLPVVSVRYGSLPALFKEGDGLFYGDTPADLIRGIGRVASDGGCRTREKVTPYSWQKIAGHVLEEAMPGKDRLI